MALSQPATFNEPWSDQRVFAYLTQLPPDGVNADFHVLYTAYKHMRPHDFERLLVQFTADGRQVNATNPEGQTLADLVKQYPLHQAEFLALLARFSN
ncbi:MAG: PA4642 family protein [Pseudomonadota bacterium]|nr:PA4642 family protein [Pseudomonadota bacterium]